MERFLKDKNILKEAGIFLLFALVSLIIFYPTLKSAPLWDDWNFLFQSWTLKNVKAWDFWIWGEYRRSWPLFYSTISVMLKIFKDDVIYYRLVNVALHSANSYLIYRFIKNTSGKYALILAFIYLIHPANFLSVAWIIQLKTLLAVFFFMLALRSFWKFDNSHKRSDYITSLIFWLLSLMSKSVFSPVILLLPFYKNRKAVVPFILIGVYSIGLTLWSSHLKEFVSEKKIVSSTISPDTIFTPDQLNIKSGAKREEPIIIKKYENPLQPINLAFKNLARYSAYVLYPGQVLLVQPSTKVDNKLKELILAVLTGFGVYFVFRHFIIKKDYIAVSGFAFYCLTLFPLCGIFYIPLFHFSNFVEYWLTVPLIGVVLVISRVSFKFEKYFQYFLILCAVVFSVKMYSTSRLYSSTESIILKSIEKSPKNILVKLILAKHYFFTDEYAKSSAIIRNVKKDSGMDTSTLDQDIEKNERALSGEKIDKTSL